MDLKINEIFYSIQGESSYLGYPCVFVRLSGCNLRCRYCDTTYAYEEGSYLSPKELFEIIGSYKTRLVTITGGEPLLQPQVVPFIKSLLEKGYQVLVETNGSLPISVLPEGANVVMDIKCPGSGMSDFMCWENINFIKPTDEVKFVLTNREDYEWAKAVLKKYDLSKRCQILFSAVFKELKLKELAEWILKDQIWVRLQPQLHKIIWGEKRGR